MANSEGLQGIAQKGYIALQEKCISPKDTAYSLLFYDASHKELFQWELDEGHYTALKNYIYTLNALPGQDGYAHIGGELSLRFFPLLGKGKK